MARERRSKSKPTATEPAAVYLPLDELKPWPGNPRDNAAAVDKVARSIERFGFGAPIVARAASREIIAGHTRFLAAKKLKLREVPVRLLDVSEADARKLALADNKLGEVATWNDDELDRLLEGMRADAADDVALMGFLDDGEASAPDPITVETTQTFDEFWLSVRGPLAGQRAALEQLAKVLRAIPGVQVELGTTDEDTAS